MEQISSREDYSRSVSQENFHLLWNLKVHCHIHKILPLVPILSQMNPVYILQPNFIHTHFNIIPPSRRKQR
jgi:hypothetical protein